MSTLTTKRAFRTSRHRTGQLAPPRLAHHAEVLGPDRRADQPRSSGKSVFLSGAKDTPRFRQFKLRRFKSKGKLIGLPVVDLSEPLVPGYLPKLVLVETLQLKQLLHLHHAPAAPIDALANARARGQAYKRAEMASAEQLPLTEAAQAANRSEKWVNTLRQRGELYALAEDGRERGFRYPRWQFDADKSRLTSALAALSAAGVGSWGVHAFMQRASDELGGRSPREWILDDQAPIAPLLQLIARRFAHDQGAS